MTRASHLRELGLDAGADIAEIRAAYRALTLRFHPDNKQTGDRERWQRVRLAYEALAPVAEDAPAENEGIAGQNVRREHEVSFLDALHGRRVTFTHAGSVLPITLPPGVETGQRIRFPGRGEPGSPPGDLLVDITVAAHKHLVRDGLDLRAQLRLTWAEAAAGGPLAVPTPWADRFWLRYDRGAATEGTEFTLTGHGVRPVAGERGDLIYTVTLIAPHWASRTLLDELRLLQQADAPRADLEASLSAPTNHHQTPR